MKNPVKTTLIPAPHLGDGAVIEVDVVWQGEALALLCHPNPKLGGDMNNKVITALYRHYRTQGMSVVRFNYRGVGLSSGQIDYGMGEFFDACCVLRWVLDEANARQISLANLHLCGFSFGGVVACRLADYLADVPMIALARLILIAPSIVKHDVINARLPKQTLMIYGNQDEWVSPHAMQDFADKLAIKTQVLDGAGHFFDGRLGELTQVMDDVFSD